MTEKILPGEWIFCGTTHLKDGNVFRKLLQTNDNNYHNQGEDFSNLQLLQVTKILP